MNFLKKEKFENLLSLAIVSILGVGFTTVEGVSDEISKEYHKAVVDAAFPLKEEISSELVAISKDNKKLQWSADGSKILVTTWKSQSSYERFLKPNTTTSSDQNHVIWITTVPQVKNMCQKLFIENRDVSKEAVDLRLKKYLGLSFDWQYDVFVEMWVDPKELFRPCVDPEINDKTCNLHFENSNPTVKNIPDYKEFYRNLYYSSFRSSTDVPWTGLGYTYDWGNPNSEVGASEYILVPGASYEIKQVLPTMEYCQ